MVIEPDPFDPRYLVFEPQDRFIHATNRDVKARVDDAVFFDLVRYAWNCFVTRSGKTYFRRGGGTGRKTLLLHREVMRLHGIVEPTGARFVVDHKSGCEFDCRLTNLRWATYLQNTVNRHGSAFRLPDLEEEARP